MTLTCALGFFVMTCTSPEAVNPAARFCQTASLVKYSTKDTAETRRQLRAANAKYRAVCSSQTN